MLAEASSLPPRVPRTASGVGSSPDRFAMSASFIEVRRQLAARRRARALGCVSAHGRRQRNSSRLQINGTTSRVAVDAARAPNPVTYGGAKTSLSATIPGRTTLLTIRPIESIRQGDRAEAL